MIKKVLLQEKGDFVRSFFEDKNIHITVAKNSQRACELLKQEPFDLVFCEEMAVLKEAVSSPLVVLLASSPCVDKAVESVREGAFDYLAYPPSFERLEACLEKAEGKSALKEQCLFHARGKMEEIITESVVMKKILEEILKVAKSNASVFICGESGTGKEVIAHALHYQSHRASFPFIKVNCAAIPEALLESEFFGHEKGSFTGAIEKRLGRFELAHQGSLLLDEVSEIPLGLQAKLLRAIQEQEFERVGGTKSIRVDVRFISTSNRQMKEAIQQKIFREDLYYRLNVIPIHLPPLRERREDILSLADYFLARLCKENRKKEKKLAPCAQKELLDYHWPGNIRELANVIERAVVMDLGEWIEKEHLRLEIACPVPSGGWKISKLEEVEKAHILQALDYHQYNKTQAAKTLGISIRTLRNKLAAYGNLA